jgi:Domain of Unknown Function with PDB structure (DUF3857)
MTTHKSFSKTLSPPKPISRTLLCLLAATLLLPWAGSAATAKDDWLPIPPEDLALKDNPKSPGAHSMILYRESSVDAHESRDDEYLRVKIFTQEGVKEEGDVEIPFVKGVDDIKDIRARTVHADGTIVNFEGKPFEKTVVKVSGFKYLAKTFTLPDVRPGSIIEYKYRDQSDPNFYFNDTWTVQGDLFTRLARFSIKPDSSGYAPQLAFRYFHLPGTLKPQKQSNGFYTLEVHDLPGIEEEAYMAPEKELKARVEFYYDDRNAPANETVQHYWERIGKSWSQSLDIFLNKKGALESDLSRIISPNDPPEMKLRKIYVRVQQIRNLSMEESKTEKEEKHENLKEIQNVEDVIKRGYGGSRQINCLFIGLARAAGFEATAAYVTPRSDAFFVPNSRESSQLTADLAWVRSGTQEYFLDPGSRYFPFGSLPWNEAGAMGIRVNKQGFESVTTPFPPPSDSILARHADLTVDEDGALTGTIAVDFNGQAGALWRVEGREEDDSGRKKSLEDEIKLWLPPGSTFELAKIGNWDDIVAPLHVEGTVKSAGYGTSAGRRMLLPLEFFQATQTKAFQSEKRTNDIYFHYPYEEVDDVKMHFPAGYKNETLPPPQNGDFGAVKYQISAGAQGDSLEIKRHLVINIFLVPVAKYPVLRSFFGTVKTNDDAEVVLQNVDSAKSN